MTELDDIIRPLDAAPSRIDPAVPRCGIDAENAANGLGQLAVTIVNLLHELLERQAIRRVEAGTLSDEEAENLGICLMKQSEAIDQLCAAFGINREDLNLDLGPLGNLL